MRRITNAYTKYFNDKYDRVGGLFQGVYKAVNIENDGYLLYLSRYIHRNPSEFLNNKGLEEYIWSSYREYLCLQKTDYLNTEYILQFFSKTNPNFTYKSFVESKKDYELPETCIIEQ